MASDPVPMSELRTEINGTRITVQDYAMRWHDPSAAHSTHEITFDGSDPQPEYIWVSGMMDDQIARISIQDPTTQQMFKFQPGDQPHTLRFDTSGNLWVGLEYSGTIIKLKNHVLSMNTEGDTAYVISEHDIETCLDVHIATTASGSSNRIETPINTHPHAWCFDRHGQYIWFTGKLTNTVGRVHVASKVVEHFALPTLGAVPIYVSVGPDGNVWGTCLGNNNIFRVTTGECPVVTEIPITTNGADSRPIAIKPPPVIGNSESDPSLRFMWWSNEKGHSICRISVDKVEEVVKQTSSGKLRNMKKTVGPHGVGMMNGVKQELADLVETIEVPMTQRNMLLAGLAFDCAGNVWTQSYVDLSHPVPSGVDFIVKIDSAVLNAQRIDPSAASERDEFAGKIDPTGIAITHIAIPTDKTVLHRIIAGPDGKSMWFTELSRDRVGIVREQAV
uniref:Virginiamycin B lyase n=1 Tax=Timspurckia oligopyrenoides TaxID=708627 RepID=A0A7S0ZDT2_9RHOD|mmetsp:Transcript_140/g.241  ORF Transcript_140/g.241 Transcript_140/m.241 type:complete len:447 (+) Transcript_140:251-1591(+)